MITKRELHPSLVKEIESGGTASGGTVTSLDGSKLVDNTVDGSTKMKDSSITEAKLSQEVKEKLNNGAVESLDGSKLVDNSIPEDKLSQEVKQKLNKQLIVNELDGAKLVDNTVPESKLNLNLKKKINKKIRSGYTNTLTKSYSKFARCVVPKPSGTVSLIANFMSSENKKKYQSDGEVHYILTNDQGKLVNTILLESKNARNTKMNFCARKVSETSDSIVWELYVYCLQDHTTVDLNIINEYTSEGATLEFFQQTAPLTKEQLHELGGLVIWSQPKTFIETGSSVEDKINYWVPFAEINFVEQWQGALCSLDIMDTNNVNPIKTGRLYIKSAQVQQLGNEPFVSMTLVGAVNLPKDYIKGVITKADGEMSTIKLFIKLDATYMTYLVKPDIDKSYEMILIHNGEPVQSLPSGTQINCL